MNILLVSMNFSPELTGIGRYSGEMAAALVARGHRVSVVCAPPYYPTWAVQPGHSAGSYRAEQPTPGLAIYRCPIWIPKRLRGWSRLVHLASFALSSLPVVLWLALSRPAVVFVVAPGIACAPGAWLAARLVGAKAWLHVQDFEVDAAFALGIFKSAWMRRAALAIERTLMRRFDVVSTISRRMVEQLATKGLAPEQTELMPNWVKVPAPPDPDRLADLRRAFGIDSTQTVCLYSGSINHKQGLSTIMEAARLLKDVSHVVFLICGNGEMRPSLERSARGLDNVRFTDLRPAAELDTLLAMADIHLLPQLRGAADLVMPSKLLGMLASGRPVVAAATPGSEIASVVAGRGIVTEPECPAGMAQAILALISDRDRAARLGAAGRDHAQRELAAEIILDRLHFRLEALTGSEPVSPLPVACASVRPLETAAMKLP